MKKSIGRFVAGVLCCSMAVSAVPAAPAIGNPMSIVQAAGITYGETDISPTVTVGDEFTLDSGAPEGTAVEWSCRNQGWSPSYDTTEGSLYYDTYDQNFIELDLSSTDTLMPVKALAVKTYKGFNSKYAQVMATYETDEIDPETKKPVKKTVQWDINIVAGAATGIQLTMDGKNVTDGEVEGYENSKFTVTGELQPKGAEGTVTYDSSNKAVATISDTGYITAAKAGETVITATSGSFSASVTVVIKEGLYASNGKYLYEVIDDYSVSIKQYVGTSDTSYKLPGQIDWDVYATKIGPNAFAGHEELEEVIVDSDKIAAIGDNAFANCPNLKKVVIPETVTELGKELLKGSGQAELYIKKSDGTEEKVEDQGSTTEDPDDKKPDVTPELKETLNDKTVTVGDVFTLDSGAPEGTSVTWSVVNKGWSESYDIKEGSIYYDTWDQNFVELDLSSKDKEIQVKALAVKTDRGFNSDKAQVVASYETTDSETGKKTIVHVQWDIMITAGKATDVQLISNGQNVTGKEIEIYENGYVTVTGEPQPQGAAGTVTYTSSNTSVATVTPTGYITAVKAGTTVITAALDSLKASVTIIVKEGLYASNGNYLYEMINTSSVSLKEYMGTSEASYNLSGTNGAVNYGVDVTKIGANAFANHKELGEIIISSNKITVIEDNAFANCPNLKKVVIPETVTDLGKDLLKGSPQAELYIKKSNGTEEKVEDSNITGNGNNTVVTPDPGDKPDITPNPGGDNPGVTTSTEEEKPTITTKPEEEKPTITTSTEEEKPAITPNPNEGKDEKANELKNGEVVSDQTTNGVYKVTKAGSTGGTVEYVKPYNASAANVTIKASVVLNGVTYKVTSVGNNAFKNNKKLKKITIGSNVVSIGTKAFNKCTNITKLTIPANVTKIGKEAFSGCKKLSSITIKSKKLTKKNVGSKAFKGISSKASIKVPKSKLTAYKALLLSKGVSKSAKIKK